MRRVCCSGQGGRRPGARAVALRIVILLAAFSPVIYFWHDFTAAFLSAAEHLATSSQGFYHGEGWVDQLSTGMADSNCGISAAVAQGWAPCFGLLSSSFFLSPVVILLWGYRARFRTRRGFYVCLFVWGVFSS